MHATCLELLKDHLRPGARVLDVGSGSGYLAGGRAAGMGPSRAAAQLLPPGTLPQPSLLFSQRPWP